MLSLTDRLNYRPQIYPPPTPPPFPGIEWPTITINDDLEPTATEEPDDEPTKTTNSKSEESLEFSIQLTGLTAESTTETNSKSSSSSASLSASSSASSTSSSTSSGSYTEATQKYVLAIPTVGTEELKQRNSWLAKYYHMSGISGGTSSGSVVASTTGASAGDSATISTTRGPIASSTRPPTTATASPTPTSTAAQTTTSVNPADCPNDGVRENAPNCPKPSSTTGFSCGLASNIGVATYTPATWCACHNPDNSYSTMSGDHPCAFTAPPATPITPHVVTPAPTGVPPLSDCSLVMYVSTFRHLLFPCCVIGFLI